MARDAFLNQESSGGPYEMTVTRAFFGPHSQVFIANGGDPNELVLHFEGTTSRDAQPVMTSTDGYHPSWNLGTGWQTLDGGKTAIHPSGPAHKMGGKYGKMISAALAAVDKAGIVADSAEDPFGGEGVTPAQASMWVGTKWLIENVLPPNARTDGQYPEKPRDYPVAYLGRGDVTSAPVAGATAPVAAAAPAGNPSVPAATGGESIESRLTTLAQQLPWAAFQSAAFQVPGVIERSDLVASLATEAGFYAQARA